MKRTHHVTGWILVLGLVLGLAVVPLEAQIPEKFENLQILPKDISRGELVGIMRQMAGALGQRCHYCHVGEPGGSLDGYDFKTDELETKKKARVMMKMVGEINDNLLPGIGKEKAELVEVRCVTCHHGQSLPRTLAEVLKESLEDDGIDAAVAKYRELREKYYGRATFDFNEWRLVNLAEELAKSERLEEAHRFIEVNLEFYPDFGMNYVGVGQYHQQKGENDKALAAYKKAAELMPNMASRLQPLIDQLTAGASSGQ